MSDGQEEVSQQAISVGGFGKASVAPPTFTELWGIVFLALTLGSVLIFAGVLLTYYLLHLPAMPSESGNPAELKSALDIHKSVVDQYRDNITFVFDLVVTKTILPLITLLLGYLFGRTRST